MQIVSLIIFKQFSSSSSRNLFLGRVLFCSSFHKLQTISFNPDALIKESSTSRFFHGQGNPGIEEWRVTGLLSITERRRSGQSTWHTHLDPGWQVVGNNPIGRPPRKRNLRLMAAAAVRYRDTSSLRVRTHESKIERTEGGSGARCLFIKFSIQSETNRFSPYRTG